ncbi:MAG: hypothetical protein AW10_00874 [Candidatus Accumulibacter appositus]|uniref:Alkaline phosphatase-like protein PglZ C-terminal domain-containing protein n=1 Tax=Candidatus Accumulibacter appositus TaxID=1454003 RepID=A0A011QSY2_9PROT|nr:MAG: hypothetical protein AW10_00874 [Candidatus Accumulibacter appositus]
MAPADADLRSLFEALAARAGKLSKAAKRVLNIDQAAALVLDETAGTVELNRELLGRQFRVTVR